MRLFSTMFFSASLVASAAMAAEVPKDSAIARDTRCLVVAAALQRTNNPDTQNTGRVVAAYYQGRLDGRLPEEQLLSTLKAQHAALVGKDLAPIAKSCLAYIESRAARLRDLNSGSAPQAK